MGVFAKRNMRFCKKTQLRCLPQTSFNLSDLDCRDNNRLTTKRRTVNTYFYHNSESHTLQWLPYPKAQDCRHRKCFSPHKSPIYHLVKAIYREADRQLTRKHDLQYSESGNVQCFNVSVLSAFFLDSSLQIKRCTQAAADQLAHKSRQVVKRPMPEG